jgi:hypothetical protein
MKTPLRIIALALLSLATYAAAQNATTLNVVPVNCGSYNPATYYCPNLKVTDATGTERGWFYYPTYNGHLNQVGFTSPSIDLADVSTITTTFDGAQYTQTLTFHGPEYSGTSVITYTTYRGCVSGRVSRCSTYWKITGGTINIQ